MTKSTPKMQTYIWTGKNQSGKRLQGELTATNTAMIKMELRHQGIRTQKIKRKPKPLFGTGKKKIKTADIAIFSRQLATMMSAGVPITQAFDIIARGHTNPSMQELIEKIKNDVESGSTLSAALRKSPSQFDDLFCSLVNAGEQSGTLEKMLDRIAQYKERIESIKGKIKKALFYPIAVIFVAIIITAALLIFVVPQFESVFQGFGADLPAPTQVVIELSRFFQAYWWLMFAILFLSIYGLIWAKKHFTEFARLIDKVQLKLPIVGIILRQATIARFARTLSITFAAGLPLVEALKSVAGATGNSIYANATQQIRADVSTGQQIQQAMRSTNLFPNMVIQMIAIGEESGSLENMLAKVADFFEEDVDNAVDSLSSLLEPLIMVILGIIVGSLVISMYLPIFQLGSVIN